MDVVELGDLGVFLLDQRPVGGARLIDRHVSHHAKDGLQLRQPRFGGFRPRKLLVIQSDRAIGVFYRDEGSIKTALGNRLRSAGLTDQREVIHRIAINAFKRGYCISTHPLLRLGMHSAELEVARINHGGLSRVSNLTVVAHHLRATGDHEIFHARHDLRSGKIHRGDARAAEAIESDA